MLKTLVDIFCFITVIANNYWQILNLIFLEQPLLCLSFTESIKILNEDRKKKKIRKEINRVFLSNCVVPDISVIKDFSKISCK